MQFLSLQFVVLMLSLCVANFKVKKEETRQYLLLIASWFFYLYFDYRFFIVLFGETMISYLFGGYLYQKKDRRILVLGIVIELSVLLYFKYLCIFFGGGGRDQIAEIVAPVGISFFTLQAISYMVDIYSGRIVECATFRSVALFISFFPIITSGPIMKAYEFLPQLGNEHNITIKNLRVGGLLFLRGALKKYVLADNLGVCVNSVYEISQACSWWTVLAAVFSYSLQIYFDFSGYSDMAMGVAKMIGYDLTLNFNNPYRAQNPTNFWNRWHISLSTWLRDYVYIPLGGSRKSLKRTFINILIVMLLSGFWHGAKWTFIIWGLVHGAALGGHKIFRYYRKSKCEVEKNSVLKIAFNFAFVTFAWIFFRAESITDALNIFKSIFSMQNGINYVNIYSLIVIPVWIVYSFLDSSVVNISERYLQMDFSKLSHWFVLWTGIIVLLGFRYTGDNYFIYSQF